MGNRAKQEREAHPGKTVTRRGRNFIEFDLGRRRREFVASIEPMHTVFYEEVDTEFVPDVAPWGHKVASTDYSAQVKTRFNDAQILRYTDRLSKAWVQLQPMALNWTNDLNQIQQVSAVQAANVSLDDSTARWNGAYGAGRDFEYIAHPKKLIKHLVLSQMPTAPAAYIVAGGNPVLQLQFIFSWSTGASVHIDGAEWNKSTTKSTAGSIEFKVAGETVYSFTPAYAEDAEGNTTGATMRVRKAGGNLMVDVLTPYSWLQTAVYPVMVDPTLTLQPDAAAGIDRVNTWAVPTNGYGASASCNVKRLLVADGGQFSTQNTVIKFDLSSIPLNAQPIAARLSLFRHSTSTQWANCTLNAHRILEANSGWTESGSWNYAAPGIRWAGDADGDGGEDAGCTVSGVDFAAPVMLQGVSPTQNPGVVGTEDTWELVGSAEFQSMLLKNYGMVLYCENTPLSQDKCTSDHATAAYRPKLMVEYQLASTKKVHFIPVILR